MIAAGASLIGGCCGTTPEHTAAMRAALDSATAAVAARSRGDRGRSHCRERRLRGRRSSSAAAPVPREGEAAADPPALEASCRQYVVSVEIDPPRSIRIDRTIDAARLLRDAGVDLVNISDSAMARVRMGAMAVAFGIQHDLDLECLVHFTTRDRNLMAIESELLGAHALGVRNILALTGDPPRVGDYATGDGRLGRRLDRARRGAQPAQPWRGPGGLTDRRAGRASRLPARWIRRPPTARPSGTVSSSKLAAGADLVMTQPLYGIEQVESMFEEARRRFGERGVPVPLLLGILPLQSARHAEFLHHEVPGITIPDEARAAMHAAGERGAEVGLEESLALLEQVGDAVAGTYIMPSFGRYEQCAELVRRIRTRHAARATA